jgi:hypothetical protein
MWSRRPPSRATRHRCCARSNRAGDRIPSIDVFRSAILGARGIGKSVVPTGNRTPTLAEAGISKNLAHRARRRPHRGDKNVGFPKPRVLPAPATAMRARRGSRRVGKSEKRPLSRYLDKLQPPWRHRVRSPQRTVFARCSPHTSECPCRSATHAARVPAPSARPECCTSPASCRRWRRAAGDAGVATAPIKTARRSRIISLLSRVKHGGAFAFSRAMSLTDRKDTISHR